MAETVFASPEVVRGSGVRRRSVARARRYLTNARDLVIDAYGATFVFYYGFGLQLQNSVNVTVRGLTFDADPPNYAQGVVTSVAADNASVVATFDGAFLEPDTTRYPFSDPDGVYGAKVSFWEPSTRTVLPGVCQSAGGVSWEL